MRRSMPPGCFALLVAGLLGGAGCARKPDAVACTVTYGGESRRFSFPATDDPYAVQAVDIAGRFLFKATYIREPSRAASINLYAYERADDGDRLLQEAKYAPSPSLGVGARHGFTGRQLLYSQNQRELEYWCELSR